MVISQSKNPQLLVIWKPPKGPRWLLLTTSYIQKKISENRTDLFLVQIEASGSNRTIRSIYQGVLSSLPEASSSFYVLLANEQHDLDWCRSMTKDNFQSVISVKGIKGMLSHWFTYTQTHWLCIRQFTPPRPHSPLGWIESLSWIAKQQAFDLIVACLCILDKLKDWQVVTWPLTRWFWNIQLSHHGFGFIIFSHSPSNYAANQGSSWEKAQ